MNHTMSRENKREKNGTVTTEVRCECGFFDQVNWGSYSAGVQIADLVAERHLRNTN